MKDHFCMVRVWIPEINLQAFCLRFVAELFGLLSRSPRGAYGVCVFTPATGGGTEQPASTGGGPNSASSGDRSRPPERARTHTEQTLHCHSVHWLGRAAERAPFLAGCLMPPPLEESLWRERRRLLSSGQKQQVRQPAPVGGSEAAFFPASAVATRETERALLRLGRAAGWLAGRRRDIQR